MQNNMFHYIPNFMNPMEQKTILDYLNKDNLIAAPQYANSNSVSRYQKWYQADKKYFCPLWKQRFPQWESHEIDNTIQSLIDMIQKLLDSMSIDMHINSCLVNKYPDGKHFISKHRDSAASFGEEPTIIILSLGETRQLSFEKNETNEKFTYDLEGGSIFIMSGASQKDYMHSLEKSDTTNVRYSLTFREFLL